LALLGFGRARTLVPSVSVQHRQPVAALNPLAVLCKTATIPKTANPLAVLDECKRACVSGLSRP
jgi:hypothetical protein